MVRHTWIAIAGLALMATPALAQHEQHGKPAEAGNHADMMTHMVCEMGTLPSFGMHEMMGRMGQGQGMMGQGQGMMGQRQDTAKQGMQHQGMQPGQAGAAGQGMQHGQAGAAGQAMGGMMGGMDHTKTAHMLMEHGDDMGLALTEAQKAQIAKLAEAASSSCQTHLKAAHAAHAAADAALEKGDVAEYGRQLESAATHAVQAHVPVIRSGIEAKALLTKSQRDRASGQATGMRQRP